MGNMNKEYYIIDLYEKSREGTLLFWKPKGFGYTSDFKEAGLFDSTKANNANKKETNTIAMTKEELLSLETTTVYTVVNGSLLDLNDIKKKLEVKQ